jgi:hypothetical protein
MVRAARGDCHLRKWREYHGVISIRQQDSWLWLKVNGVSRYLLVHLASGVVPFYVVNEFPRSGGTWLSQMLARALAVPFPRDRLPALRSAIMHGHYLRPWNMRNVVVIWRDGRDALVSLYFHTLFNRDKMNERLARQVRRDLHFQDDADVRANLPRFIEYTFRERRNPRFSWADFVDRWYERPGIVYTRYRDLLHSTASELRRVIQELTGREVPLLQAAQIADEFSFERQTGRARGQESRTEFLRKGVTGDWKSYFTPEAREVFDHYGGNALIALGFERDHSWVQRGTLARSNDETGTLDTSSLLPAASQCYAKEG